MDTRKVRYLKDEVDLDLDVVVCEDGQEEEIEVINDGIMFKRWVERNKEDMWYQLPESEEDIIYTFID